MNCVIRVLYYSSQATVQSFSRSPFGTLLLNPKLQNKMKKSIIIILLFFAVTSCVSVPRSTQNDIVEIKTMLGALRNEVKYHSNKSETQISKLDESYKTILKGIVKPSNVVTNYDNLSIEQLDSLRSVRGLIKKD